MTPLTSNNSYGLNFNVPLNPRFDPSSEYACLLFFVTIYLALGFVLDEDSFSSRGFNAAFHYASAGFDPAQDNSPAWTVKSYSAWVLPESTWPVKNQRGCGDCWAYAVVAAVEAAHRIASNRAQPPVLSVEHLRLALPSNCDGGSPTKALQFLLNAIAQGKGLLEDAVYSQGPPLKGRSLACSKYYGIRTMFCPPSLSIPPPCLQASTKYYGIRDIECTGFYGWFGLMLAVQPQPVIVHIEASAPSFQDYDGVRYPPSKTTMGNHLNHVVLVVGYLSAGSDPSNSAVLPPFWIIRNSWGTAWGDHGHMRMDIRSGDGICGINTLPGLFPVVRNSADPCGSRSFQYSIQGPAFNPCGRYNCSKKGTSNRCKCTDARFAQVRNTDGSYTCAYVDVCGSSTRNPCVVGTCVNDGKGSYSCVCPPGFIQGTTLANTASCAPGNTPLLLSFCALGNTPLVLSSCAPSTCSLLLCSGYLLSPPVLRVPALSSCAPGDAGVVYTVRQSNEWCSHVHPIFALTLDQFLQQNKDSASVPDPQLSLACAPIPCMCHHPLHVPSSHACAIIPCMCHHPLHVPSSPACAIIPCMCHHPLHVPSSPACAIIPCMCHHPMHVPSSHACAIIPCMCHHPLHVPSSPACAIIPCMYHHPMHGDTCTGVGRQVELCGAAASDAECEAAFQALNPAVDCSSPKPSQAVCIERDPGVANVTVVCDQYYRARLNDTCDSIRQLAEPPLSPVDFYRLNPGVNCNQLIPLKNHFRSATTFGAEVSHCAACSVMHAV
ncbi:unnamed protein product [Closterium sp. NIES-64]|nr:unnamed protein product [Closterium sp. NIES-64]